MKAEINSENKARFFALYWGQHLVCSHSEKSVTVGAYGTVNELTTSEGYQSNFNKCCLQLKPLSSISDEDAKNVALIEGFIHKENSFGSFVKNKLTIGLEIIDNDFPEYSPEKLRFYLGTSFFIELDNMQTYEDNRSQGVSPSAYDYLRSRGHALPWMGLSVEELVEVGWIKLIEQ